MAGLHARYLPASFMIALMVASGLFQQYLQLSCPLGGSLPPIMGSPSLLTYHTKSYQSDTQVKAPPTSKKKTKKKPMLLFHVGPPKTATTTLQTQLFYFKQYLEQDGWFYGGRYYDPFVNGFGKVILNRHDSSALVEAHDMMRRVDEPHVDLMQAFKDELSDYLKVGQNVLLSDEAFSNQWESEEHYEALSEALSDDWDVRIILGYRHFYDWMPSNLFQVYKMDPGSSGWKNKWPGQGGKVVQLAFPDQVHEWPEKCHTSARHVVEYVNGRLPIIFYDLHITDYASVRSQFLCDAVPDAPKSCAASLKADKKEEAASAMESAAAQMNTADSVATPIAYDMVTTAAFELGWIDTDRHMRMSVRQALLDFTENQLGSSWKEYPMICPTQKEIDHFLQVSLNFEDGARGMTPEREAAHRQGYQKRVDSGAFCRVDLDKVLEMDTYRDFFLRFHTKETNPKNDDDDNIYEGDNKDDNTESFGDDNIQ